MNNNQGQTNQTLEKMFANKSNEEKGRVFTKTIVIASFVGFLIGLFLFGEAFGGLFTIFYFATCAIITIMSPFYFFGARKKGQKRRENFFLKQLITIAIVGLLAIIFALKALNK